MELILLVVSLLAFDVAVFLFGADTRPGFEHSARSRPLRPRTFPSGTRGSETERPRARRFISG